MKAFIETVVPELQGDRQVVVPSDAGRIPATPVRSQPKRTESAHCDNSCCIGICATRDTPLVPLRCRRPLRFAPPFPIVTVRVPADSEVGPRAFATIVQAPQTPSDERVDRISRQATECNGIDMDCGSNAVTGPLLISRERGSVRISSNSPVLLSRGANQAPETQIPVANGSVSPTGKWHHFLARCSGISGRVGRCEWRIRSGSRSY